MALFLRLRAKWSGRAYKGGEEPTRVAGIRQVGERTMLTDGIAPLVSRSVAVLETTAVSVNCLPHLCKRLFDGHGQRTQRDQGVRVGVVFAWQSRSDNLDSSAVDPDRAIVEPGDSGKGIYDSNPTEEGIHTLSQSQGLLAQSVDRGVGLSGVHITVRDGNERAGSKEKLQPFPGSQLSHEASNLKKSAYRVTAAAAGWRRRMSCVTE